MHPKVIKNESEYRRALRRIDDLIDADPDTPEGDELELWSILVDAYESVYYPVPAPDPVEAIRFRMEQLKLRPVDLAPYLGGRGRVSEILNGKRTLSIAMIVTLSRELDIPLESLMPKGEPRGTEGPGTDGVPRRRAAGQDPVTTLPVKPAHEFRGVMRGLDTSLEREREDRV
jgi:HTH-type transcriptional regulator/antitoxin HigA